MCSSSAVMCIAMCVVALIRGNEPRHINFGQTIAVSPSDLFALFVPVCTHLYQVCTVCTRLNCLYCLYLSVPAIKALPSTLAIVRV